jgi:sulfotransferase family protein
MNWKSNRTAGSGAVPREILKSESAEKMSESATKLSQLILPNLIIGGVNRSGTTSLFSYLSEHPQICPSKIKETDYFAPVLKGGTLPPIETYAGYFGEGKSSRYRMEASPRYIFGGARIARTIYQYLGPVRIIFVFRNPITRIGSYFQSMKRIGEVPLTMTFDQYALRALAELPAALAADPKRPVDVYRGSVFTRGIIQGFYVDYLEEWYDVFPQTIHISFFEHLTQNPRTAVQELCGWLGVDTSVYDSYEFTQENRSIRHRNQTLFKIASLINGKFEPFWRRHKNLKRWIRDVYCRMNEAQFGDITLSESLRTELERVYASPNQKLLAMLSEKGYRNFPTWLARVPNA